MSDHPFETLADWFWRTLVWPNERPMFSAVGYLIALPTVVSLSSWWFRSGIHQFADWWGNYKIAMVLSAFLGLVTLGICINSLADWLGGHLSQASE